MQAAPGSLHARDGVAKHIDRPDPVGEGARVGGEEVVVSWIGALLNSAQVEDKTWFIPLLVLGLLSFGLVAMIAYVITGPDGTQRAAARAVQAPA